MEFRRGISQHCFSKYCAALEQHVNKGKKYAFYKHSNLPVKFMLGTLTKARNSCLYGGLAKVSSDIQKEYMRNFLTVKLS